LLEKKNKPGHVFTIAASKSNPETDSLLDEFEKDTVCELPSVVKGIVI